MATYVEDTLAVENNAFNILTDGTEKRFDANPKEHDIERFQEFILRRTKKNSHSTKTLHRSRKVFILNFDFITLQRAREQPTWLIIPDLIYVLTL